ncbi:MAG TPA: N-acetylmuramoyl-L-alanine amidase [Vicinamibacterales bacterium]|nr:N-acetylmuramoyl-L-alanine amidase [Vicinamibacterales bacterium]
MSLRPISGPSAPVLIALIAVLLGLAATFTLTERVTGARFAAPSAAATGRLGNGALAGQAAPAPELVLLSREGRRSLPLELVSDLEFVGLDQLATLFQLSVREESGAITVSYKGKTIVLTPDQALASVSGRLISLPAPPSRSGRRWLVPVEFIGRALGLIYDQRLDLRKSSRLLVIGDLRVPRIAVRYDPLGSTARLTIDATPRATSTVSQGNDRLTIRFDADALDIATLPTIGQGPQSQGTLIQAVKAIDATSLSIDLGSRFAGFKATSQPIDTTERLVIDIASAPADAQTPAAGQPGVQPTGPLAPGTQPPAGTVPQLLPPPPPTDLPPALGAPASPVRTIAIDAGHGGEDAGVKSDNGLKEKDLTLAIARRVKAVIEGRLGIRVLLTRDDDRNVPIDERTAIANNNKADLFISIHLNGSMRKGTSGAEIFCAALEPNAAATAALAGVEHLPAFGGGTRDIELVRWDYAQTRHIDQSVTFAGILEQLMRDRVPLATTPVDRAPLRVLESANMPAALIEAGYLTNPEQEKAIASEGFQGALVQSIYDAVVRFRDLMTPARTE